MKYFIRLLFLAGILILVSGCASDNDGPPSHEFPPAGPLPPGGMPPPPPFNLNPHEKAAIYIRKGVRSPENEYEGGKVSIAIAEGATGITETAAEGVLLTSSDYTATGLVVAEGSYKLGGDTDYYTLIPKVENDYLGAEVSSNFDPASDYNFNSVFLFTVGAEVTKDAKVGASGIDASNKGEVLHLDNVYLQVDGAQRYVSSTFSEATTVVNDSYLVSTGDAGGHTDDIPLPFSNEALLISGAARTNFTIGSAQTYYFNSTVVAEGWAALSTDAAAPEGLDLHAYNSKALALNGGYGTYADFFCRVWLHGAYLEAAEIGGIISKSGEIHVLDGESIPEDIQRFNTGASTTKGSHIKAGRNALMIHAPDMMGEGLKAVDHGTLNVIKSTLETSNELVSDFAYETYGKEVAAYVEYIKGDVILIKSTSATIKLDETTLISSNGVLFHTVLNSDRMGNFLSEKDNQLKGSDGSLLVRPIRLLMVNMSAAGDILHDDYHRDMDIKLEGTKLEGRICQGTFNSWTQLWKKKGITEASWLPNTNWQGKNELSLTIDGNTEWIVTEESTMSRLTIEEGASITPQLGHQLTLTVDGKERPISPGTYQGEILFKLTKD